MTSNNDNNINIQAGRYISELQELDSMPMSTELLKHTQEQEVLACFWWLHVTWIECAV